MPQKLNYESGNDFNFSQKQVKFQTKAQKNPNVDLMHEIW